jgi:hypothetical protein
VIIKCFDNQAQEPNTVDGKSIENPKIWESNYLFIFPESPRVTILFFIRVTDPVFFSPLFFDDESWRKRKGGRRNVENDGSVVTEGETRLQRGWNDLLLRETLVYTRMRSGRFLVNFSKSNSGCQNTNTSVDQHLIHRNGRKFLRKWRMFSWSSTHSSRTQTKYPTYPLGTIWKLGGCPMRRTWICDLRMTVLSIFSHTQIVNVFNCHSNLMWTNLIGHTT